MIIAGNTQAHSIYKKDRVAEVFACNYGFNETFADRLFENGLRVSGRDEDGTIRIVELPQHPFYIATLFVPQMISTSEQPHPVKFLVHGPNFEDGISEESEHVQVDFGLDSDFLFDEMELTEIGQQRVKENIAKLVAFSAGIEKHCGIGARLLWSESDENLAQKLIARLQRLN